MNNILLQISYDGTSYCGWQRQNNSISIQEKIETAIYDITKEKVNLIASGRTDAGVHALCQIANFFTDSDISPTKFAMAINSKLPNDIRILSSDITNYDFNARFSAKKKTYMYQIYNSEIKSPFYYKYSMQINKNLDIELMKQNIAMLIGTYDFTSFYTAEKNNPKNPIRTIYDASIKKDDNLIKIYITGNGFLYNMVRIISGTLIDIGLHKKTMSIKEILCKKDRTYAGATARSNGLFLKKVEY